MQIESFESFAFYISVLRKNFTQYCLEKLSEVGVTYGQLYIIIYLGKKGQCSPMEISKSLSLDAGHLTRTLSKLMKNDLINQTKNMSDRRANIVSLTEKGMQIFEMSHNLFYQWDEMILSSMDESDRQKLMEFMKKITFHEAKAANKSEKE